LVQRSLDSFVSIDTMRSSNSRACAVIGRNQEDADADADANGSAD